MDTENVSKANLLVVDTNVLISDTEAISSLMSGGNTVCLPYVVLDELENLKNSPNVGSVARKTLRKVEALQRNGNSSFIICQQENFSGLKKLDQSKNDHRIIATVNSLIRHRLQIVNKQVKRKRGENLDQYRKIKLVTNDVSMIIISREFFKEYGSLVKVENYRRNRVKPKLEPIQKFTLDNSSPEGIGPGSIFTLPKNLSKLKENDGVIIQNASQEFIAMRKGKELLVLDEEIAVAGGIKAKALNGDGQNWSQVLALHQLMEKGISCVFLEGGAGTGKTLLALAAGIAQKDAYDNILVMRPMVHLGDEDKMGFLKGDIKEKYNPWLKPIEYNLKFIFKSMKANGSYIFDKKKKKKKDQANGKEEEQTLYDYFGVEVQILDYIRGLTIPDTFFIIDEAQNLTPMQIKTIITRAGRGSKFIFTGDLSQIDVKYLTEETSGLAHAISKLHDKMPRAGNKMIATTIFTESLRSPLAKLAVEQLGIA